MKENPQTARSQFLGKGIRELQNKPEFNRTMYWIFSSLEKFQKEVQDCRSRTEAFSMFMEFVENTGIFHAVVLYRVNRDNEFVVDRISNESLVPNLEVFFQDQIRSGKFAWALQQNREVMVEIPNGLPGKRGILHALSTRSTTLGMFVGFLKEDLLIEVQTLSKILSFIIDSTVYVLENRTLEYKLIDQNQELEKMVESRTEELVDSNQRLHQTNAHLKKLNEKKSEFLGIVAHDLKNPISGIIGLSQLIELSIESCRDSDGPHNPDSALSMLRQISDSATQMADALNQLMNSETIESGKIQLEPTLLELDQVVQKVVFLNSSQANAKGIHILTEYDPEVSVIADPLRIQEAIDNLMSNAIKYSPLQSKVTVSVKRKEGKFGESYRVSVSIKDEGPGLSADDKEKLFGRFQKLSPQPTAGESSTGLGLFIFKRLIDLHNGEVWVNSKLGCGSEFGFDLPVYLE